MLARNTIVTAMNALIVSNFLSAVLGGGVALISDVPSSSFS